VRREDDTPEGLGVCGGVDEAGALSLLDELVAAVE
jgi:hypothetical protein